MLWLFGQIWLWLLIAFALGAGSAALVLTWWRRSRPRQPASRAEPAASPAPPEEETQHIPVTGALPSHRLPAEDANEITTRQPAVQADDTYPPGYADPPGAHTRYQEDHGAHAAAEPHGPGSWATEHTGPGEPPPEETGHRSGTLPSWREWHARNEWPDEEDVLASEHRPPRRGG